jgi:hypothetical protein
MIIAISALIAVVAIVYVLGVRAKDLPAVEPVSPFEHLDQHKAAIYENLRDLQFEYRLGKLSDADYQSTKQDLQKELATVLAEVDRVKAGLAAPPPERQGTLCPSCGACFEQNLKFCGECGKAIPS